MKKRFLFTLLSTIITLSMTAQDKLIVYVTGDNTVPSNYNKIFATAVVQEINSDGHFSAVEVGEEVLASVASSQTADISKIASVGSQLNADYVFAVELSNVLGELYAASRIVNVKNNTPEAVNDESAAVTSLSELKKLSRLTHLK